MHIVQAMEVAEHNGIGDVFYKNGKAHIERQGVALYCLIVGNKSFLIDLLPANNDFIKINGEKYNYEAVQEFTLDLRQRYGVAFDQGWSVSQQPNTMVLFCRFCWLCVKFVWFSMKENANG